MRSLIAIIIFSVLLAGCASSKYLRTVEANPADVTGTFDVILYGSSYLSDVENVAILDVTGDRYTLEPYAPDFDFSVVKDVPAKEAIEGAEKFVSWPPTFWRIVFSRILDPENRTIGYEVRPFYDAIVYGTSDVMDIDYWLKPDGKVKVVIKLKPRILRLLFGGDGIGVGQGGGGR